MNTAALHVSKLSDQVLGLNAQLGSVDRFKAAKAQYKELRKS